jgi:hypothetical protein
VIPWRIWPLRSSGQRHHPALELFYGPPDDHFIAQRRAHAPQLAGPEVAHRVKVVVTGNHRKEPASWGCHVAACSASSLLASIFRLEKHMVDDHPNEVSTN